MIGCNFYTSTQWTPAFAVSLGEAYRQICAESTPEPAASHRIEAAYLAAGGDLRTASRTPYEIIAALHRMFPEWMNGAARRYW